MAKVQTVAGDVEVVGTVYATTLVARQASITEAMLSGTFSADKLTTAPLALNYTQVPGTAVVAETKDLHVVAGAAGSVESITAVITGAIATDASRHVVIDLQKSTGAAAFASILTATFDLTSSNVLRTAVSGTVSSSTLVAGDILRMVVTVSGGSGSQAQGLLVTTIIRETP